LGERKLMWLWAEYYNMLLDLWWVRGREKAAVE
jgi:hypothetical protein